MKNLILIENDLFDISARLKGIDENYQIYFNGETRRFEIHSSGRKPTLQIVTPYDRLDWRTVDYTRKTRVEYRLALVAEIDKHNQMLENEKKYKVGLESEKRIENYMSKL